MLPGGARLSSHCAETLQVRDSHVVFGTHKAGVDPAPERTSTTWADFLRSRAGALIACDFFETVTLAGARLYVLAALRSWLAARQVGTGRGGVTIVSVAPDAVVREFRAGRISGVWMPAPYDVELAGAGGRVLASEDGMPPGSRPAAVNLVVTRAFGSGHGAALLALVKAQVQANDIVNHDLLLTATAVDAELAVLNSGRLPVSVLGASLAQITYTDDPGAASLAAQAPPGQSAGVAAVLPTLYDIAPLNLILRMAGERPVSA